MFLEDQYFKAIDLINTLFKDKKDKGGHPYTGHLIRVSDAISKEKDEIVVDKASTLALFYDKAIIVALLHDIVEDTSMTCDKLLRNYGFDREIVNAIDVLTRKDEQKYYFDYVEKVSKNDLAKIVKIHDFEDNMNITRLTDLKDNDLKRIYKYWHCWMFLRGEISGMYCNATIHPDRDMFDDDDDKNGLVGRIFDDTPEVDMKEATVDDSAMHTSIIDSIINGAVSSDIKDKPATKPAPKTKQDAPKKISEIKIIQNGPGESGKKQGKGSISITTIK